MRNAACFRWLENVGLLTYVKPVLCLVYNLQMPVSFYKCRGKQRDRSLQVFRDAYKFRHFVRKPGDMLVSPMSAVENVIRCRLPLKSKNEWRLQTTREKLYKHFSDETFMNLTLLFDLDDTLLDTNTDIFLQSYFQLITDYFKDLIAPDVMLPVLLASTRKMVSNTDPSQTLQEVFSADFFPKFEIERGVLQSRFDSFYADVFPTLRKLTKQRPEAISLVNWSMERGYYLAVATNPLFPLSAIQQRLCWSGLPPEHYSFEVISAYESFHFSKPNPAYFAEVLGRMGWPEGPILMVGDDVKRDLRGSCILGLPVYWINSTDADTPDGLELVGRGSIGDLRSWLENNDLSSLEPACSTPEALSTLMLSSPAVVSGLLEQAKGQDLMRRPEAKEWNLTEIICHLRDTEVEINLPRLRMMLELDEPFIPARNSNAWAEERGYNTQNIWEALSDFTKARIRTLEILHGLKDEWNRKARHAIFGPTNLLELVNFMAEHDKLHIRQIISTYQQIIG